MPALTVKAVTKALSDYVRPDEDIVAKLNMVMPRLYAMGMWRDLLYDWSIQTTNDYFALPEHSESLIGAMLENSPVEMQSQWHDYRISGYASEGPAPIFGVIDDGFHEAKEDLKHADAVDVYYISVKPIAPNTTLPSQGSVTIIYGADTDYTVGEDSVKSYTFDLNGEAVMTTSTNRVASIKSISFSDVPEDVKITAGVANDGSHLSFELIGSDLGGSGNLKWRGIAQSGTRLYATPYIEDEVLVIDPSDDTTTKTGDGTVAGGDQKFVDSITASNGKVYANPSGNDAFLEVNGQFVDPPQINTRGTGLQSSLRGGAEANGFIYSSVYYKDATAVGYTPVVSKFSLSDYSQTLLPFTPSRTGGIYDARPNWSTESGYEWTYDSYFGATKAGNKVYLTPYGADRVVIVDTTDDSISFSSGNPLTGNEPYYTGAPSSQMYIHNAYFNKYSGGTYVGSTGCIYCFPRHANSILKIDTSDDSTTELPLPSVLKQFKQTFNSGASSEIDKYKNKSYSSVLGPDGLVYSIPYELPYIFWIDPETDEIGYKEISSELAGSGSALNAASDSWYSYGAVYGDAIYMAPQKANYVMKMNVSSDTTGDDASNTTLAVVKGDGVARYRRFRFANSSGQTKNIKLLLKRAWQTVLTQDDIIYLGNLNAIKHGLLGMLAEDNADLERAQYHWTICRQLLDEELDAARGAAKPKPILKPVGNQINIPNII
jgi:hypothetical protein